MKIVAVIPAHLASGRFPRKILFDFYGLPMVEHVRRRALLSTVISDVFVATCDKEIADVIESFGGKVIMTTDTHTNGTSRVAEAIESIDCSHVMLLQGDEPLLLPVYIDKLVSKISKNPEGNAWNLTGPIKHHDDLDRHSFVKCAVSKTNHILYCFRRSPCFSDLDVQKLFIRKMLGIIAYQKKFLLELNKLPSSPIEQAEFIEQMRIIENGFNLESVPVDISLPSVNEPEEVNIVLEFIQNNVEQQMLLDAILN